MDNVHLNEYIKSYGDTVYRVAYSYTRNRADSEDIVQDTFVKLMKSDKRFESNEHVKAWLIRVAANLAKNAVSSVWCTRREELSEQLPAEEHTDEGLSAAMAKLDGKYSAVIYLHYYEGYNVREISKLLKISEPNVKARLKRGREKLKAYLGEK